LAGVLEFFGGIALILGIFTRQVAFVLAGQMAAAYWMAHGREAFWPILNRGELAALYCFVFLFLFAHGGGEFSIDGWLRRRGSAARRTSKCCSPAMTRELQPPYRS
jgi:putative oxidoreductase